MKDEELLEVAMTRNGPVKFLVSLLFKIPIYNIENLLHKEHEARYLQL